VLRDVSDIDLSTTLLGRAVPAPLVLAPTGFTRIADPQGELAVARAAAERGLVYTLSTLATRSIEDVAAVSQGPKWFQVYVWRDRGMVADMVRRAEAEGYEALMVTVDTAVFGRRERDVRRGFTLPPTIGLGTIVDGVRHPGWTWAFVRGGPITFANVSGDATRDGSTAVTLSDFVNSQFDTSLSWKDIEWLRSLTKLPVMVKGLGSAADARIAAEEGLAAVVVSNHGGRQLDGAPATLDLLAETVDAVGDGVEVLLDGGVRRGTDLVVARALGARAVLVGRPYLYGLGAGGERGVGHVLDQLLAGAERTLALLGVTRLDDVDASVLRSR
jgi:L-lactate dehydrogenase (cytochrome)